MTTRVDNSPFTAQTVIAASGYGLHQVLYTTALGQEGYKDQNGLGKSPGNVFDPQISLDLGTEYLARMFVQTDGTEQSDYIGRQDLQFQFAPALRAFNASLRDGFTVVVPFCSIRPCRDRATTRCNWLISNGVGGRRLVQNDAGRHPVSSP
jgi:hypothetical protein